MKGTNYSIVVLSYGARMIKPIRHDRRRKSRVLPVSRNFSVVHPIIVLVLD